MRVFGLNLEVFFLVRYAKPLAYGWHYSEAKAMAHLKKVQQFHSLEGEVIKSGDLEAWLEENLNLVVLGEGVFKIPDFHYKNRKVYEEITAIPRGQTRTYSQVAAKGGVNFPQLLITLLRNPFQILIPCHRLLTKRGGLMGFYPLGKEVKAMLLEREGAEWSGK